MIDGTLKKTRFFSHHQMSKENFLSCCLLEIHFFLMLQMIELKDLNSYYFVLGIYTEFFNNFEHHLLATHL